MSDEAKRREHPDDEDGQLTAEERAFKRLYPETWKHMEAERDEEQAKKNRGGTR